MENNENIQMPEINEIETVNANETVAEESNQETSQEQKLVVKRRRLNLGGPVEQVSMTVMAIGLAAVMLIGSHWAKYVIAGICALAFLVPIVIRAARKSGGINAEWIRLSWTGAAANMPCISLAGTRKLKSGCRSSLTMSRTTSATTTTRPAYTPDGKT